MSVPRGAVGRIAGLVLMVSAALGLPTWARPAAAWHGWPDLPYRWGWPGGVSAPIVVFPAALPVPGHRLFHPPGLPLSYLEAGTGTTYCLSQTSGFYFVCGYSRPAPDPGEAPPHAAPPPGDEAAPAASGVLLFRLPGDAEVAVDGEPVGLSGGLGIAAVSPGRHRVVVRQAGAEVAETLSVAPHVIVTVTPTGIVPANR